MPPNPVALGRFDSEVEAQLVHHRLRDAGIPSKVVTTRTSGRGEPTGFALLVPEQDAAAANDHLLPEHRPSQSLIREAELTLRIAFAVVALVVAAGFLFNLFRR